MTFKHQLAEAHRHKRLSGKVPVMVSTGKESAGWLRDRAGLGHSAITMVAQQRDM